jgi:hypothetical protein
MLDARYSTRRSTAPPAASIVRCQASLRASSATAWSAAVAAMTSAEALESASVNSWRRPASSETSMPAVTSEPAIVRAVRLRRPKSSSRRLRDVSVRTCVS